MESVLKHGDTFIDIGANIGYLTARGAGLVGKTGEVHSFEPALPYFQKLERLSKMNQDYRILVNHCALGEEDREAELHIAKGNIGGSFIAVDNGQMDLVKILMRRFDKYAEEKSLKNIKLIKIDVEGYEFPVLKGCRNYFENTSNKPVIICEIFPRGYPCRGATITEVLEYMRQYGYKTYNICHHQEEIDITKVAKEWKDSIIFKPS